VRPREFDHDEVLRIAFDQFWRRGVRGTSLSDIARDAGVQRGSLYNAFGSKQALFLSAYERYAGEYLSALQKALGSGTLRQRLTAFFDLTIKNFRSGSAVTTWDLLVSLKQRKSTGCQSTSTLDGTSSANVFKTARSPYRPSRERRMLPIFLRRRSHALPTRRLYPSWAWIGRGRVLSARGSVDDGLLPFVDGGVHFLFRLILVIVFHCFSIESRRSPIKGRLLRNVPQSLPSWCAG